MSILKTTLVATSIVVVAGASAFAQQSAKPRLSDNARAAYAASFAGSGYHPGNVAADTTREGLVATSQ